jgi:hypothetical protein
MHVCLPYAAVRLRVEQRPHTVEERNALDVGEVGDPAHRGKERHHPVTIEDLHVRDASLSEGAEWRVREGTAPLARLVTHRAEIERVLADLLAFGAAAFVEKLLDARYRRIDRACGKVPHRDENARRSQDADDFGDGKFSFESMEGRAGTELEHGAVLDRPATSTTSGGQPGRPRS